MRNIESQLWGIYDDYCLRQLDRMADALDLNDKLFLNEFLLSIADEVIELRCRRRVKRAKIPHQPTAPPPPAKRGGVRPGAGQNPYGITAAEKEIIKIIKMEKAGGMSDNGIARMLNDRGIKTKNGKEWRAQQIKNVLTRLERFYNQKK